MSAFFLFFSLSRWRLWPGSESCTMPGLCSHLFWFVLFVPHVSLQVCPENPRCLTRMSYSLDSSVPPSAPENALFLFPTGRCAFCPPGGSKAPQRWMEAAAWKVRHWWHLEWRQQARFCRVPWVHLNSEWVSVSHPALVSNVEPWTFPKRCSESSCPLAVAAHVTAV